MLSFMYEASSKLGAMLAPEMDEEQRMWLLVSEGRVEPALTLLSSDAGQKIDVTKANPATGNTLLHAAAEVGAVPLLAELVTRGADVNAQGAGLCTALHLGVTRGHVEVAAELVRLGASTTVQDEQGRTAAVLAQRPVLQVALGLKPATPPAAEAEAAAKKTVATKRPQVSALYEHANGTKERVRIVKEHSEADGGGFAIFVPSLKRERQTVGSRLSDFEQDGAPYVPRQLASKTSTPEAAAPSPPNTAAASAPIPTPDPTATTAPAPTAVAEAEPVADPVAPATEPGAVEATSGNNPAQPAAPEPEPSPAAPPAPADADAAKDKAS